MRIELYCFPLHDCLFLKLITFFSPFSSQVNSQLGQLQADSEQLCQMIGKKAWRKATTAHLPPMLSTRACPSDGEDSAMAAQKHLAPGSNDSGSKPTPSPLMGEDWPVLSAETGFTRFTNPSDMDEKLTFLVTIPAAANAAGSAVWVRILPLSRLYDFCSRRGTSCPFYDGTLGPVAANLKPVVGVTAVMEDGGYAWLTLRRPSSDRKKFLRVPGGTLLAVCRPEIKATAPSLGPLRQEENLKVSFSCKCVIDLILFFTAPALQNFRFHKVLGQKRTNIPTPLMVFS